MGIDCSKTLNYVAEKTRMCRSYEADTDCSNCGLYKMDCNSTYSISQKHIDIVQKWSDEHPLETMAKHFFKVFPNAPKDSDNKPMMCLFNIGWIDNEDYVNCDGFCTECWNRPYIERGNENA